MERREAGVGVLRAEHTSSLAQGGRRSWSQIMVSVATLVSSLGSTWQLMDAGQARMHLHKHSLLVLYIHLL